MAILKQRWFLDVIGQRIVRDLRSNLDAVIPPVTQGDTLSIELHTVEPAANGGFRYIDASDLSAKVGIFSLEDTPPTDGTIKFGYDGDWTPALAFDATSSDVETALNALSSITSAGGVTVTKLSEGTYKIAFSAVGSRELLLGDSQDAYPSSYSKTRWMVVGDVDTKAVQRVILRQNAVAGQATWTDIPSPAATVTVLSTGNNQVQKISFSSVPVGGQLLISYGTDTITIPSTGDAVDLRTALEGITAVGEGNVTVTGSFEEDFIIVFGGLAPETALLLETDVSGLQGPKGKSALLEVEGSAVDDLLGEDEQTNALLEIELTEDSRPFTLIQQEIELRNGRNEPESDMLPPQDKILGESVADARYVHKDDLASQVEAEAGTDNTKWLSPLRVFQAIAAWIAARLGQPNWFASLDSSGKIPTAQLPSHTHPSTDISDSTTTGRSLLTAEDAAAVRSVIGSASTSQTGVSQLATLSEANQRRDAAKVLTPSVMRSQSTQNLSSNLTLISTDDLRQILAPQTSDRDVILPVIAATPAGDEVGYGHCYEIIHDGAANSLLVKNSSNTLVARIDVGEQAVFYATSTGWIVVKTFRAGVVSVIYPGIDFTAAAGNTTIYTPVTGMTFHPMSALIRNDTVSGTISTPAQAQIDNSTDGQDIFSSITATSPAAGRAFMFSLASQPWLVTSDAPLRLRRTVAAAGTSPVHTGTLIVNGVFL